MQFAFKSNHDTVLCTATLKETVSYYLNSGSVMILTKLFAKIFNIGIIPSTWKMAIIKPIPKSSMIDAQLSLQYRAISLLSTVYKLFSSLLNVRISKCAEDNSLFASEQNRFRGKRSCEDHVFVLSSIIRHRKAKTLPTYIAFIDMEKALIVLIKSFII